MKQSYKSYKFNFNMYEEPNSIIYIKSNCWCQLKLWFLNHVLDLPQIKYDVISFVR